MITLERSQEVATRLPAPQLYPVAVGPLAEAADLTAGMDYYKPAMSQLAYNQELGTDATFTFKNRGNQRLLDYIDPTSLQERFDALQVRGFTHLEINYFASLKTDAGEPVFAAKYLDHIGDATLPTVTVGYDAEQDDITIDATGPWELVTFWETIVMSEVNEAYFESYLIQHDIDPLALYQGGDERLSDKIAVLQQHPDIHFSDFGTRRHFSLRWQKHVVERLQAECPENFTGTSNVALARVLGAKAIGTFAHEMPMVYAGLANARGQDVRGSHQAFLQDWNQQYGQESSIALTDTFTTEFFFEDFTAEQAASWNGLRHDSGDPIDFGERAIQFYEQHGIDPSAKTIIFSDGLNLETILDLHQHFKGRIGDTFGWGTSLTNDLGLPALNVVMKATHVRTADGLEADTVKLSDNIGKHTGPTDLVARYATQLFCANKK